jgi:hypothetical protein
MLTAASPPARDVHVLAAWSADLTERGYVPGAPSVTAADIDGRILADADCEACGRNGLVYRPFMLPARDGQKSRYLALGECRECGHATEFLTPLPAGHGRPPRCPWPASYPEARSCSASHVRRQPTRRPARRPPTTSRCWCSPCASPTTRPFFPTLWAGIAPSTARRPPSKPPLSALAVARTTRHRPLRCRLGAWGSLRRPRNRTATERHPKWPLPGIKDSPSIPTRESP